MNDISRLDCDCKIDERHDLGSPSASTTSSQRLLQETTARAVQIDRERHAAFGERWSAFDEHKYALENEPDVLPPPSGGGY